MQHNPDARAFALTLQDACLGTRIGRLHRLLARHYEQALRPHGLSMPQVEILSALVLRGAPTRPSELADVLLAERSTVSRNVAALQARGWTETADTSPTGRSMSVQITADGEAALATARAAWADAQAAVMGRLGDGAPGTLDRWLADLTRPAETPG